MRRQIAAGLAPENGETVDRAIRRWRRYEVFSWGMVAVVVLLLASVFLGQREMDLADAPRQTWVAMETLDPGTAGLERQWRKFEEGRFLLVYVAEVQDVSWDGPQLTATLIRAPVTALAGPLYREQVAQEQADWLTAERFPVTDPRFDEAVLILARPVEDDGRRFQTLVVRRGRAILRQSVADLDTDLTAHLDDFDALLADFE